MNRKRRRRMRALARWAGVAATVLLLAVYIANLPLYMGSGLGGGYHWRMEAGRILFARAAGWPGEAFFVAYNTEGLKFSPAASLRSWSTWAVAVPLWIPLAVVGGVTALGFVRERRARRPGARGRRCAACGYALEGLRGEGGAPGGVRCPECGAVDEGKG